MQTIEKPLLSGLSGGYLAFSFILIGLKSRENCIFARFNNLSFSLRPSLFARLAFYFPIMNIKSAEFVISSSRVEQCPSSTLPEYAFIGRSNVGKSSLINMLTGRKSLAMTSSTPGKTMLINHFCINGQWHLVDLPGYGYAKRSKKATAQLQQMIEGYITRRESLVCLFLLIDSRIPPQKIDLEFTRFLGENGIPFAIVFTKADKLGVNKVRENVQTFLRELSKEWEELPPHFITSSQSGTGREELLGYIEAINKEVKEE